MLGSHKKISLPTLCLLICKLQQEETMLFVPLGLQQIGGPGFYSD